jgi:hypothetical protein
MVGRPQSVVAKGVQELIQADISKQPAMSIEFEVSTQDKGRQTR